MLKCLFCAASEDLTDEHVIPGSLGCNLTVRSSTCRRCNERFSSEFESAINNSLKPITYVLGIGNRDGIVPSQDVDFDFEGKRLHGHLTAEGELVVRPNVEKVVLPDGKNATHYWLFDKKSRDALERRVKERGHRFEVGPLGDGGGIEVQPGSTVPLDFIASDMARRFAAKIAFMALAWKVGMYAGSDAFAAIRKFIVDGGRADVRLFVNAEFKQATQLAPFHHFIVVWAGRETHRVWAAVVLFGGLSYVVQLSDSYDGADFGITLAYDCLNRKPVDFFVHSIENERFGIELVLGAGSKFDDLVATAEAWREVVEPGGRFIARLRKEGAEGL